jgi:hypothetical protein
MLPVPHMIVGAVRGPDTMIDEGLEAGYATAARTTLRKGTVRSGILLPVFTVLALELLTLLVYSRCVGVCCPR